MARRPRLQFAGAVYHVMARGNRKSTIFNDDADRSEFFQVVGAAVASYELRMRALCLKGNHYHFILETPATGRGAATAPLPDLKLSHAGSTSIGFDRRSAPLAGRSTAALHPLRQCPYRIATPDCVERCRPWHETIRDTSDRYPSDQPAASAWVPEYPGIVPADSLRVVRRGRGVGSMSRSTYLPGSRGTRLSFRRYCAPPGN
jgi:hypothetical protein